MTVKQLDIFGAEEPQAKTKATSKPKRPRKKRAPREVKKAPMLVDAYQAKGAAKAAPQPQPEPQAETAPHILSVSELTARVKAYLEGGYPDLWVSGEVTDFRNRQGRHYYFALKDERSKVRAIIFGAGSRRLGFDLEDGMELVCHGRLNVYEPQGSYSLIIDHCEPKGLGALQLAFEQLKKKLEGEGLFAAERKRPLPFLPRRIGLITSPTGAAVRDIIHVLTRRFSSIEIALFPVRVQGEGAAPEIAHAIERMNERDDLDLLIVGRGGGSIEDLWAFNEEIVARAIAASGLPVISAVGHEIDFTIADFVADVRAPTPSAAAEIAVPVRAELMRTLSDRRRQLAFALLKALEMRRSALVAFRARLGDPRRRLPDLLLRVDGLRQRLLYVMPTEFAARQRRLEHLHSNLEHLSPLHILAKGYAVVEGPHGGAVTRAAELSPDDELRLRFHEGAAAARVTTVEK